MRKNAFPADPTEAADSAPPDSLAGLLLRKRKGKPSLKG